MVKLNNNQDKLLHTLKENIDNPLSISSLCEITGISSKGMVHHHLVQLEKKGFIKRNPINPRDYFIMDSPEKAVMYVSKYGNARCGPGGTLLDGNPEEQIPIPSILLRFPASEAFIVEAKGRSMEPRIFEGDVVIAQKQSFAEHGNIVVCTYELEVLIKKYFITNNEIFLYSLSPNQDEFPPRRVVNQDDLKIEGIVKNILQYN